MVNYQNGKIYKIVNDENDDIYVGSTCDLLVKRFSKHKVDYKAFQDNGKKYISSYKILEKASARIELIENYPCNSKEELLAREGYYIRELNCVNRCIAGRTEKEYREEHKEEHNEYVKKHYQENKDVYLERARKQREEHKEEIAEYKKKWYEENKDKVIQREKERYKQKKDELILKRRNYYQENRDLINQRRREKRKKLKSNDEIECKIETDLI